MKTVNLDVLVLGGGMAGLRAVVAAKSVDPNLRLGVLQPSKHGQGGCSPKTHGVNAAMNAGDSPDAHYIDTMVGGGFINNPQLVRRLCDEAPRQIRWLEEQGMKFAKNGSGYDVGYYGGSTNGRSIHCFDTAGRRIMQILGNLSLEAGVLVYEDYQMIDLVLDDNGVCCGTLAIDKTTHQTTLFLAGAIVLATGGGACVYPIATISNDKVAAGIVTGYLRGARVIDMEMVQFHPTGLNQPGLPGHGEIMEEELRSMGGTLKNACGEYFMAKYDVRKERATRDVVARGMFLEIQEGRGTPRNGVYFDLSTIKKDVLESRFPYMVHRLRSFGADLLKMNEVEVSPSAHFLMGGLEIDVQARTTIPGLFACGEDAGGIHGGNRLGGNGMADALVFGAIAGQEAANLSLGAGRPRKPELPPTPCYSVAATTFLQESEGRLKKLMWDNAGLVRSAASLHIAEHGLLELYDQLQPSLVSVAPSEFCEAMCYGREMLQKIILAFLVTRSAAARLSSVGAHYRKDSVTEDPHNTIGFQDLDLLPRIEKKNKQALPNVA